MDGSRFDRWSRALATGATRRRTLQAATGGVLAGLLAHVIGGDVAAACVKPGKKGCAGPQNRKCCKGAACQGGSKDKEGRCKCKGSRKQCGTECVNTKSDRQHCGRCNRRCHPSTRCRNGTCVSELGCRAGDQICHVPSGEPLPLCPGTANPNCFCMTDVEGTPRCVDDLTFECKFCVTNANCGPGRACFDPGAPRDRCCTNQGNPTTFCASATCDGKS